MKFREPQQTSAPAPPPQDNSSDFRVFAAWMGLVIIAFGLAISGYLLVRIGQVLLDPRGFETQVDRWEFVVRGRTSDAFPEAYETPDRQIIRNPDTAAGGTPATDDQPKQPEKSRTEEVADLAGRIGSKSARPVALFLIVLVLTLIVRIAIGIIHAGIRLAYITAGERDYMKRILEELLDQRQNRD